MLACVKELGVLTCPLRPVVKALDQSNIAILEFENLLNFDWDLFNIKVKIETHHISTGWIEIVQFHFNGVLDLEFIDFSIILIENEAGEADNWLED